MNNKKSVQVSMDLRTSVNYTEVQILNNNGAFFVDTEFGVVCVETNAFKEIDPTRTVTVLPWSEAPSTNFASDRCEETADWWASVDIYNSHITDHLSIIELFIRAMFLSLGFDNVEEAVIDASVYLFIASYDSFSININMIEREFRKNHLQSLRVGRKKQKVIQSIMRDLFTRKIDDADKIYQRSEALLESYIRSSDSEIRFYDEFCKELFGIILYANNEVKEEAKRSHKRLVDFNNATSTVDNSMEVYKNIIQS